MKYPVHTFGLVEFIAESNRIEGIERKPTAKEIEAAKAFLQTHDPKIDDLNAVQAVIAPGRPIRSEPGMNVRVGNHVAPAGGPGVAERLSRILASARNGCNPWQGHLNFEDLHPYMDGNGRTGRLLWAWNMRKIGADPFALPFLHRFYYQTLSNVR